MKAGHSEHEDLAGNKVLYLELYVEFIFMLNRHSTFFLLTTAMLYCICITAKQIYSKHRLRSDTYIYHLAELPYAIVLIKTKQYAQLFAIVPKATI